MAQNPELDTLVFVPEHEVLVQKFASLWLLQYPEHSRVIRTLFDE